MEQRCALTVQSRTVLPIRPCGHGECTSALATPRTSCLVVLLGPTSKSNPLDCHDGRQFRQGSGSRMVSSPGSTGYSRQVRDRPKSFEPTDVTAGAFRPVT